MLLLRLGDEGESVSAVEQALADDVVVAIEGDVLKVIGGNVGQTVGRTSVRTSHGFVDLARRGRASTSL